MKIMIIAIVAAVFSICGRQLWVIDKQYSQEAHMRSLMEEYKPDTDLSEKPKTETINVEARTTQPEVLLNYKIKNAKLEINQDIAGWLDIPGGSIDYAFVQTTDNEYYLHRDLYKNYANAGSIFMDYRCQRDLSGFNTILYGHSMKNGSMFGSLKDLMVSQSGKVYLEQQTYSLDIFALLTVQADDPIIYNTEGFQSPQAKSAFLDYARKNARQYKEISFAPNDRILTLSTCSYAFDNARLVVLARLQPIL